VQRERIDYKKPKGVGELRVWKVPHSKDKFLNVFFYDPADLAEQPAFSIYKLQIFQEGLEFKPSTITDVYKLSRDQF